MKTMKPFEITTLKELLAVKYPNVVYEVPNSHTASIIKKHTVLGVDPRDSDRIILLNINERNKCESWDLGILNSKLHFVTSDKKEATKHLAKRLTEFIQLLDQEAEKV